MKNEYSKIFDKPCYLIGKGIQIEKIETLQTYIPSGKPLRFVYTGNIGDERYKVLADIAKAMKETFADGAAVLDVYSMTPLTKKMQEAFSGNSCLKFHGGINRERVIQVQEEADFLVHVEGFSKKAIFSAKMSFSTKIIDYMMTGKPIFAVGPQEVNSIQVLKGNELGVVATSQEELKEKLLDIVEAKIDYEKQIECKKGYLKKHRDIGVIQFEIFSRMNNLLKNN